MDIHQFIENNPEFKSIDIDNIVNFLEDIKYLKEENGEREINKDSSNQIQTIRTDERCDG